MLTSKQRRRLVRDLESEPIRTWAIVAKCSGGLAVIALIALINAGSNENREAVARANEAAPPTGRAPEKHREQVFNERRQRFNGGNSPRNVAGQPPQPANRLALTPR